MATKLLPAAKIGVKKKTISADSIRPNYFKKEEKPPEASESSSTKEILLGIKDFITAKFKRGVSSFTMKRREKQKESIEARERNIENKEKKFKLSNLIKPPKAIGNIFSSITNFLLFVAGGILFNILGLEKSLIAIEKSLEIIGKGVEIFASIVGGFTNFIDSAVKGYDDFLQKIEDVTGFDKTKVEKFMEDFKYVINGALVAAILTVRALPGLFRKCLPKPPKPPKTPKIPKSRMAGGSNTGIDYRRGYTPSGQTLRSGPSISRFNNSMAKSLKGTADLGDIARLTRRGFFQPFKNIKLPQIPGLGMLGRSLGKFLGPLFFVIDFGGRKGEGQTNVQAGAGAGAAQAGFWGGSAVAAKALSPLLVTPVPGARVLYGVSVFGAGILGAMGLTSVTDTITGANKVGIKKGEPKAEVGDKSKKDIESLMDYADYELELTEITNNIIQPIQV